MLKEISESTLVLPFVRVELADNNIQSRATFASTATESSLMSHSKVLSGTDLSCTRD